MNTIEKLDELAQAKAYRTLVEGDKAKLVDAVLTPEIKAKLAEIDCEFEPRFETIDQNITVLTDDIKRSVIESGETVKGTHLMAVYAKGRVSWDTRKLDGLMIAIPQLAEARKEGEPSVSIRAIG